MIPCCSWRWSSSNTWSCLALQGATNAWTCFLIPADVATTWGPITGQLLWVKGLALLLQCKFCLLPMSPLWLASPLFFQAHHFMFLNLKLKVCLVSKILPNPYFFSKTHKDVYTPLPCLVMSDTVICFLSKGWSHGKIRGKINII